MILLHRITPFFIALAAAAGFFALMTLPIYPASGILSRFPLYPVLSIAFTTFLIAALFTRLAGWQPQTFKYWSFLGTPVLYLVSSFGILLFFETSPAKLTLAIASSLLLFFIAENVFAYVHLPAKYQAYSIEHLSLAVNSMTLFFFAAVGIGANLLIGLRSYEFVLMVLVYLMLALFVIYNTLWVGKVEHEQAFPYSIAGAVLTTELFAVMTFLPTSFYSSAALLAVFVYTFLGLTRAHFLNRLSKTVLQRYVSIALVLLLVIIVTARWT